MDKPKPKKHRQPPLKIDLPFDEAMKKIVLAKPPKKKWGVFCLRATTSACR